MQNVTHSHTHWCFKYITLEVKCVCVCVLVCLSQHTLEQKTQNKHSDITVCGFSPRNISMVLCVWLSARETNFTCVRAFAQET